MAEDIVTAFGGGLTRMDTDAPGTPRQKAGAAVTESNGSVTLALLLLPTNCDLFYLHQAEEQQPQGAMGRCRGHIEDFFFFETVRPSLLARRQSPVHV